MTIKNFLKKEPTIFLFGKLWRFAEGHRGGFVLYVILFIIANLVSLIDPLIFAELLNEIQRNGITESNLNRLLIIVLLLLATTFVFWIFHGIGRVLENRVAFYVRYNYKKYLLEGVLDLGLNWHSDRDSGDTIDKIIRASDGLGVFSRRVFLVIEILVRMVGTALVLYLFNPYISIAVVPFVVLSLFILFQFDKRLIKQYRQINVFENRISAKIFDALSNITSVIVLNVQKTVLENVKKVLFDPKEVRFKNINLNELKWFTGSVLFDLLVVIPLAFYLIFTFQNNIAVGVGTISALYLYLSRLSRIFFSFSGFYEDVIVRRTAVQNAEPIEEYFDRKKADKEEIERWSEIKISDLSFSYEDAEHHVKHLEVDNFALRKGGRIALIGESGSRKTTFLKVLHNLYDNAKASVEIDDKKMPLDISKISFNTMLVPQEPELFSASIRENITFGIDYSDDEVLNVTQLAEFNDVLNQLPHGLESKINEKGVNLSGGQKQRLALARALLFVKDKDIILLDESTSSVDPTNEVKIYQNIFDNFEGKTVIASIHKMNLLKYFDRIVIFDKGRIVDQGSFEELLKSNNEFKKSWNDFIKSNK